MSTSLSQLGIVLGSDVVPVDKVTNNMDLKCYIQYKQESFQHEDIDDPFLLVDLGRLLSLHSEWNSALPGIHPFYAVKCNEDPLILKTLAALGTGFDCASKNEICSILSLGVSPDRIIYANPCKSVSHIKYAAKNGVSLMTFDNELELFKIKKHFPTAKLVLRIRADDPDAIVQLGIKYGCSVQAGKNLLFTAFSLNLDVVGVSFHVGSGCQTPSAFRFALELASEIFRYADTVGYHLTLLDIGGGFPGDKASSELFYKVAASIHEGLEVYFKKEDYPDLRIIAEPGRFFAASTHVLVANVISKRLVSKGEWEDYSYMYYINDGIYGSFNCILYDHNIPTPEIVKETLVSSPCYKTSVWGPTCDGIDKVCDTILPELDIGDLLYFDNMGAYTVCAYSSFNGFTRPTSFYYVWESESEKLKSLYSSDKDVSLLSPLSGILSASIKVEVDPLIGGGSGSGLGMPSGHVAQESLVVY